MNREEATVGCHQYGQRGPTLFRRIRRPGRVRVTATRGRLAATAEDAAVEVMVVVAATDFKMNMVSNFWRRVRGARPIGLLVASVGLALTTQAKDRWICAQTEHFEVLSNASEREARLLVARLEQFRETFLSIVPGKPFHEPRTTVVIFGSDRDFRPYKPLYNGKPKENLAGVFRGAPDEVVIAMSTERELERTIPTIYHEYVHLLMHARGYRFPPWLNEGVAELYETIEFEPERVMVGRHNPIHVMKLNRGTLMPLAQLFSVTHGSPEYNETDRKTLFYAQSWALVHYCVTAQRKNKKQGEGFGEFLGLMSVGTPPEQAMQQAYGMSLEEMERDLGSHVRGGRYVLKTYTVPKVDYAARVTFRPATDFERDVGLANLKWRLQRNGDATYELMQLAERELGSPRPQEVLAAIVRSGDDRRRALDYWTEAARLGTTNAYVYVQLAEDSLRQYLVGAKTGFRLHADACAELRAWLDRAVALDPNYAEAWDWLALTEAYSEKPRGSIVQALQAKRKVFGDRPRILAGFALIALRATPPQPEFAERLADVLLEMPSVKRRPERDQVKALSVQMNDGRGQSWTHRPEYFPELAGIARAVKAQAQKQKPAADKASEPVEFELPDAY
jgi:hypothetical protein